MEDVEVQDVDVRTEIAYFDLFGEGLDELRVIMIREGLDFGKDGLSGIPNILEGFFNTRNILILHRFSKDKLILSFTKFCSFINLIKK